MQPTTEWARQNFGSCELGDARRTNRLVQVAQEIANHPAASLPDQLERWGDLKAAYRLFDRDEVSFAAIARPHWELTRQRAHGRTLVMGDTTELDFGKSRKIEGVGPTGNGSGQGFLLHNALMVAADSGELLGVAGQTLHYRPRKMTPGRAKSSARSHAKRESQVWGRVIDDIGRPALGVEYFHILDRGGDFFEVYCHLVQHQSGWVVRAGKLTRQVLVGEAQEPMSLQEYLPQLGGLGGYRLPLRARPQQAARAARLEVRVGQVSIPRPQHVSPYVRALAPAPIPMRVVEVVEVDPPAGVQPIHWILLTSLPVTTLAEAETVIGYYEQRWLVEEYHKALKTGCRAESRQLKTAGRLEAFVALSGVVAVRLLQLKSLARHAPATPAAQVVPRGWLKLLQLARKNLRSVDDLTVGQFYREVAKLGGFLGRTGDGEPGWITLWRGWEKLHTYLNVASKLKLEE